jgi:hypothetical protein
MYSVPELWMVHMFFVDILKHIIHLIGIIKRTILRFFNHASCVAVIQYKILRFSDCRIMVEWGMKRGEIENGEKE